MKIYLASPFFNGYQRNRVRVVADWLIGQGNEVYIPMAHEIENAWDKPNHQWAMEVFEDDKKAIDEADEVYVIGCYGMMDDAGTCWEAGYAYGTGKPFHFIIDSDAPVSLYSLMLFNSATTIIDINTFEKISKKSFEQS